MAQLLSLVQLGTNIVRAATPFMPNHLGLSCLTIQLRDRLYHEALEAIDLMTQGSPQRLPPPKAYKSIGRFLPRRVPLNNLQIILIALVVISGRLIIDFSQRILEGQDKVTEQHALEAEIAELTQARQQLKADKAYYSSPTYVEAWAHDQGKMVRQGEVLVIPVYDKRARTGLAVTSSEPARPLPTWQVWWFLFFDSPSPFTSSTHSPEGMP